MKMSLLQHFRPKRFTSQPTHTAPATLPASILRSWMLPTCSHSSTGMSATCPLYRSLQKGYLALLLCFQLAHSLTGSIGLGSSCFLHSFHLGGYLGHSPPGFHAKNATGSHWQIVSPHYIPRHTKLTSGFIISLPRPLPWHSLPDRF
jgi:hypothetical protein